MSTTIPLEGTSVEALFAGQASGAYDLPDDLLAAAGAIVPLEAKAREADAERDRLRPARQRSLSDRDAWERADDAARQAAKAATAAVAGVEGYVQGHADHLVVNYLRPSFSALLADVAKVAPALAACDVSDTASVSRAGAGAPFLVLAAARVRLDALHAALGVLCVRSHRGQEDARHLFRDCRAFPGGVAGRTSGRGGSPEGPAHPLTRLLWLATDPAAEPWLPAPGEWDERWRDWLYIGTEPNRYAAQEAERRSAEHLRLRSAYLVARDAARDATRAG